MLKYFEQYEGISGAQMKTFRQLLGINLCLLKILLVFAKLVLFL